MSVKIPPSECPACGYDMDAAETITGPPKIPRPDDFSICINCGEVLCYNKRLQLTLTTPADMRSLRADQLRMISKAQHFIWNRGRILRLDGEKLK